MMLVYYDIHYFYILLRLLTIWTNWAASILFTRFTYLVYFSHTLTMFRLCISVHFHKLPARFSYSSWQNG